jgi:hypothetical protein
MFQVPDGARKTVVKSLDISQKSATLVGWKNSQQSRTQEAVRTAQWVKSHRVERM